MADYKIPTIAIVGAGLAGCEAAFQLARFGFAVTLFEMRPKKQTPVHQTEQLAELVCSNSFRSDDASNNAVGLLHQELRKAGSLIMQAADHHRLPAGGALAVDRGMFASHITHAISSQPNISLKRQEVSHLPVPNYDITIITSGPLTSDALASAIISLTGNESLAFFDAIAPIIHAHSIDETITWRQSRYDKGDADYINCPMDEDQYERFIDALLSAPLQELKAHDQTPFFEGCLPIEVMAKRGKDTLRFGPMKPVGLSNPYQANPRCHAIVQLRQDNTQASLWNIVGFQTRIQHHAQAKILQLIPGLQKAEFARLGSIHRNSYLKSPNLLDPLFKLRTNPTIRFAGQITGVEGYVESAATGLMVGLSTACELMGEDIQPPPQTTALGSLMGYVSTNNLSKQFQPMNVNFGLFLPLEQNKKVKLRGKPYKQAVAQRASVDFDHYLQTLPIQIT